MGRNIVSICDECREYLSHLRGKESEYMQQFQKAHEAHEKHTRIVSDYVEEEPEGYMDVTDNFEPQTPVKIMGKSIEEVMQILSALELERVADMQMTMEKLGEWMSFIQKDMHNATQKALDQAMKDMAARLKEK